MLPITLRADDRQGRTPTAGGSPVRRGGPSCTTDSGSLEDGTVPGRRPGVAGELAVLAVFAVAFLVQLSQTLRHLLALLLILTGSAAAQAATDPSGYWEGAIALPNGELPIAVTLTPEDGGGGFEGAIDIPSQGLRGFELSNVSVEGRGVHFEMDGVPGRPTFDGALDGAGTSIAGSFSQGPQSLSFSLRRSQVEPEPAPAMVPSAEPIPVPGDGAAGEWSGTLEVGPVQLRLALHVTRYQDGRLEAILDSVDQAATLTVDRIRFEERVLALGIEAVGAAFEGTLNEDGSAIEGAWTQGPQSLPLTFHRLAEPFALHRPQDPEPPFPYRSSEVRFENADAGLSLAGTLLVPEGAGPFPAVLMITGSGPQDRDETLMGHKPFRVIADYLARRGIASLRYDDRGVGASGGDHMGSTVEDFATDAEAGIAFLATRSEVDRRALGLLGHSEGGLSAPIAAGRTPQVGFLVLLAPPGEPLPTLLQRQSRAVLEQRGVDESLIALAEVAQAGDFELIRNPALAADELETELRARAAAQLDSLSETQIAELRIDQATIERGVRIAVTPWFRSLLRQDPAVHLRTTQVPTLVLFGDRDIQVDSAANAPAVESALAAAGNQDFEVRVLPGLNHLFQHSRTGAVAEYGTIEETFAPEALELIGDWIEDRFSRH